MRILVFAFATIFALGALAQESPEDLCKAAGDYWSEELEECFVSSEMSDDAALLWKEVQRLEAQKAQRLHEQREYNASGKNTRLASYNARIASLESRRDAASDQDIIDFYQEKIDSLAAKRDYHDDFDVSEHGAIISDLSSRIGKMKEELDSALQ